LRRKYAQERDKRLRPDGNDQYLRLSGEFTRYLDDPYTPWTERAPLTGHRTVLCVGGGFAGLVIRRPLVPHQPVGYDYTGGDLPPRRDSGSTNAARTAC
jgi:hypothetical protein